MLRQTRATSWRMGPLRFAALSPNAVTCSRVTVRLQFILWTYVPSSIPRGYASVHGVICSVVDMKQKLAILAHSRAHEGEARSLYMCSRGCRAHFMSLYALALHEAYCEGDQPWIPLGKVPRREPHVTATERPTRNTMRIRLDRTTTVPSLIILARGPRDPPGRWFSKRKTLEEGIPGWGRNMRAGEERHE
ncbi:hypothetical protein BDV95DRAFT_196965 [Massariosphaeria phaeospora]|uniref:C2H2-type domain-containing protein n=1 Tax=Massariosphaeria phaeospora TaxID=100035 RepID=A0A7C8M3T4_9PLEO|nr:hypothetical protein BDV95DRAFT_196965 [Massariosphaeria phaeospora]